MTWSRFLPALLLCTVSSLPAAVITRNITTDLGTMIGLGTSNFGSSIGDAFAPFTPNTTDTFVFHLSFLSGESLRVTDTAGDDPHENLFLNIPVNFDNPGACDYPGCYFTLDSTFEFTGVAGSLLQNNFTIPGFSNFQYLNSFTLGNLTDTWFSFSGMTFTYTMSLTASDAYALPDTFYFGGTIGAFGGPQTGTFERIAGAESGTVPEPSAIVICSSGVAFLVLTAFHRRRRSLPCGPSS